MNKWQQKAIINDYKGKTYYTFMDQLNNFEDNQLAELSKAVISFCELPTNEKLSAITVAFKDAAAALEFITKNMKRYIESGLSDIQESELGLVAAYLSDLADSLNFEFETVQSVIEDETYNAAFVLAEMSEVVKQAELITS
ncbi:hypothetical protein SRABI13_00459 [Erwinia aphidicola]|uniref:hypothetical protein n=1 Tax=Erwinia aphidicola TaxID=68334 RepID=UPI001E04C4E2|nr:hypothetical protein [Erwinia aphidicola]CAH0148248.1 hypothetical protein SRABI13_00459 [Erwinia aphidicola]